MRSMTDFIGLTETKDDDTCCPQLTYKERLTGFLVCFALGSLIQFLSMGSLFGLFFGRTSKFGILYTLGNVVSLVGIFFLVGPKRQLDLMKEEKRMWTSLIFVGSMILTFVSIYLIKSNLLTLIFVIIQFGAYIWYVLSYIPYGRDIATKCIKGLFSKD